MKKTVLGFLFLMIIGCKEKQDTERNVVYLEENGYDEPFRPQYHFSPEAHWMNDPNGLVYHEGLYHLFYQYYPNATVWGPMHWGHAISTNLLHWEHKPIALYPDEKGFIFSGSAVIDQNNTSGFGKDGKVPLVAIYTYFRMDIEKKGGINTQTQGIAYSLDNGDTWQKYAHNPVIDNTTLKDFRDPKVFWDDASKQWVMVLVAGDHAKFYISKNLKEWKLTGTFGNEQGAHGGVWECPDLFKLKVADSDEEKWVLLISIGSGGPNGGSGTQYFVGEFDGTTFVSEQKEYHWLDWGTDNYAGVTYNGTSNSERIFIGWMSNWQYALTTPTTPWRSAMTLPRELTLHKKGGAYYLKNYPIKGFDGLLAKNDSEDLSLVPSTKKTLRFKEGLNQSEIVFSTAHKDFQLEIANELKERITLSFDATSNLVILDRTNAGIKDFHPDFANSLQYMAMNVPLAEEQEIRLILDRSSLELFVNKGEHVMTVQLFPTEAYTDFTIYNTSGKEMRVEGFQKNDVGSIWTASAN